LPGSLFGEACPDIPRSARPEEIDR
jgi:hypothetical protein